MTHLPTDEERAEARLAKRTTWDLKGGRIDFAVLIELGPQIDCFRKAAYLAGCKAVREEMGREVARLKHIVRAMERELSVVKNAEIADRDSIIEELNAKVVALEQYTEALKEMIEDMKYEYMGEDFMKLKLNRPSEFLEEQDSGGD